jgi:PHD/YefM family antitoxin component YafN of YafNO toxin-antitoxin module
MTHVTANTAQKDFISLFYGVIQHDEPITIVSDDSKAAVLISMEEWRGIQETLYLQSIPGMLESIEAAAAEPIDECLEDIGWDIK